MGFCESSHPAPCFITCPDMRGAMTSASWADGSEGKYHRCWALVGSVLPCLCQQYIHATALCNDSNLESWRYLKQAGPCAGFLQWAEMRRSPEACVQLSKVSVTPSMISLSGMKLLRAVLHTRRWQHSKLGTAVGGIVQIRDCCVRSRSLERPPAQDVEEVLVSPKMKILQSKKCLAARRWQFQQAQVVMVRLPVGDGGQAIRKEHRGLGHPPSSILQHPSSNRNASVMDCASKACKARIAGAMEGVGSKYTRGMSSSLGNSSGTPKIM